MMNTENNLKKLINCSYLIPEGSRMKNPLRGGLGDPIDLSERKNATGYANGSKYIFTLDGKTYLTHVSANNFARENGIADYFQYVPLSGIMVLEDDEEQKKLDAICLKAAKFFRK